MFPTDQNCSTTILGHAKLVSTDATLGITGCGEAQIVPLGLVRRTMGTFNSTSYDTATPFMLNLGKKAKTVVTRAVNRSGGTLAHGAVVLYSTSAAGTIYAVDKASDAADSPLFLGVVQGMLYDDSDPTTPVAYSSLQAIPNNYEFDLIIGGVCEAATGSSPSIGIALTTGTSGNFIAATTSHINVHAYALSASVSNVALVRIVRSPLAGT